MAGPKYIERGSKRNVVKGNLAITDPTGVTLNDVFTTAGPGSGRSSFVRIYQADPAERILIIKSGLPAAVAKKVIAELSRNNQRNIMDALRISTATMNRKVAKNEPLSKDESERLLGVAKLVGQVQTIVEESGNVTDFDAWAWLSRWLQEPLPAFGGEKPLNFLDTMEGQSLVSKALARVQSGAYA